MHEIVELFIWFFLFCIQIISKNIRFSFEKFKNGIVLITVIMF